MNELQNFNIFAECLVVGFPGICAFTDDKGDDKLYHQLMKPGENKNSSGQFSIICMIG